VFDLGRDHRLEVIATPGHAPHHVCFFEHTTRTLFTGDAAGNWQRQLDVPLTVPPQFDLEKSIASLHLLQKLRSKQLAFTHFGLADQPFDLLDRYEQELLGWFAALRALAKRLPPKEVVTHVLGHAKYAALSEIERDMVTMCVRGALLSLETGLA
jgi:glyoxylase-like metal-dependent hydrolase (beta-lactamase superfamily II)